MNKYIYENIVKEEGDYMEFEAYGMPCIIKRHSAWCGYVGVPKNSRLDGKGYSFYSQSENGISKLEEAINNIEVHGGLTFAGKRKENDDTWYFGFDCGHCDDLTKYDLEVDYDLGNRQYRNKEYVIKETKKLALQIKEILDLKL